MHSIKLTSLTELTGSMNLRGLKVFQYKTVWTASDHFHGYHVQTGLISNSTFAVTIESPQSGRRSSTFGIPLRSQRWVAESLDRSRDWICRGARGNVHWESIIQVVIYRVQHRARSRQGSTSLIVIDLHQATLPYDAMSPTWQKRQGSRHYYDQYTSLEEPRSNRSIWQSETRVSKTLKNVKSVQSLGLLDIFGLKHPRSFEFRVSSDEWRMDWMAIPYPPPQRLMLKHSCTVSRWWIFRSGGTPNRYPCHPNT